VRRIVISPKADIDVDDQFLTIAQDNLDAAQRFFTAAHEAFTLLVGMPFRTELKLFACYMRPVIGLVFSKKTWIYE